MCFCLKFEECGVEWELAINVAVYFNHRVNKFFIEPAFDKNMADSVKKSTEMMEMEGGNFPHGKIQPSVFGEESLDHDDNGEREVSPLLEDDPNVPKEGAHTYNCLSFRFYAQFFDIDTEDVVARMKSLLLPLQSRFFSTLNGRADMYGPFWISSTVIFTLGWTSNFAGWLSYHPTKEHPQWQYDFNLLTMASFIIYGYVILAPILSWLLGMYVQVPLSLAQLVCLFGYSLLIFIPCSIFCVVPLDFVDWISIAVAFAWSTLFITNNLWPTFKQHSAPKAVPCLAVIAFVHFVFSLVIKFWFFQQIAEDIEDIAS